MRRSAIYLGAGLLFLPLLWVVFHQSQKQEKPPKSVDAKSLTAKHGTASLPKDSTKDLGKEEDEVVLHSPGLNLKAELQTLKSRLAQKPDGETNLRLLREFTQKLFPAIQIQPWRRCWSFSSRGRTKRRGWILFAKDAYPGNGGTLVSASLGLTTR